jgi:hypothetical protein
VLPPNGGQVDVEKDSPSVIEEALSPDLGRALAHSLFQPQVAQRSDSIRR